MIFDDLATNFAFFGEMKPNHLMGPRTGYVNRRFRDVIAMRPTTSRTIKSDQHVNITGTESHSARHDGGRTTRTGSALFACPHALPGFYHRKIKVTTMNTGMRITML